MESNMDMKVAVQGTELRGMPPNSMRVAWWSNDGMMVCFVMNGSARVSNTDSKIQLQLSVQKESVKMVSHWPKSKL